MNTEELKRRTYLSGCVRGSFKVQVLYRGRWIQSTSTNTLAYDVIKSEEPSSFYTIRQAYLSLRMECINKNTNN